MLLSLCMIVRDVAPFIERALDSVAPVVDEYVIVDTGSTDATKDVIRRFCRGRQLTLLDFNQETNPEAFLRDSPETWKRWPVPPPFTGRRMFADFGAARNLGWDRARGDYLMWIDSDDVVENAERIPAVIRALKTEQIDTALFNYDYGFDDHGNVICRLHRERIVRRGLTRWFQPIHECLGHVGAARYFDEVNVVHKRHEYAVPPPVHLRNLKVLLHWWEAHEHDAQPDPRMLFYLGRESTFVWPERAIEWYQRYCRASGWDEERAVAYIIAGLLLEARGDYHAAFAEYGQAALDADFNPEALFGAARVAYHKKDWPKCIEFTERGFRIRDAEKGRRSVIMHNPLDRFYRPYVYYSVALYNTGRYNDVLGACDAGLRLVPDDPHLIGNKQAAQRKLAEIEQGKGKGLMQIQFKLEEPLETPPMDIPLQARLMMAIQMWKRLIADKLWKRALAFIDSLPDDLGTARRMREAREFTIRRMEGVPLPKARPTSGRSGLKIGIWTGPAFEIWTPASIDQGGIGGSETAAVKMAEELSNHGHDVTVFSDCGERFRAAGVEYVPFDFAAGRPEAFPLDIFICSRQPGILSRNWQTKAIYAWVHDIHLGADTGQFHKIDKFFCLSHWHKQFFISQYKGLVDPEKVVVTRNGIDIARFAAEPEKRGQRLIYSSSPDRGLERLLELFPEIRARVPEAELHIYYGFANWKKAAAQGIQYGAGSPDMARIEALEDKIRNTAGVVYHGRVGQAELAKAFLAAKVWAYPTWFTETHCIGAIEAQAAGCVPVTTNLAALAETVQHGFLLPSPNTSEEYGKAFVANCVRLLTSEETRRPVAEGGRKWALERCSWASVAAEWGQEFRSRISPPAVSRKPRQWNIDLLLGPAAVPPRYNAGRTALCFEPKKLLDDPRGLSGTDLNFFGSARALARRGHRVRVFALLAEEAAQADGADLDGVDFLHLTRFPNLSPADVAIAHYDMSALAPSRAKFNLAVHHTLKLPSLDFYGTGKVHASATPSPVALERLKAAAPGLWYVLPNANDWGTFPARAPVKGRLIFTAAPERGLHRLLEVLPAIREKAPEAHLVFIGDLDHLDRYDRIDERHAEIAERIRRGLALHADHVTVLPRMSRNQVLMELSKAAVFAYPHDPPFPCEVSPISVMDCLRAGVPVVLDSPDGFEALYGDAVCVTPTTSTFVSATVEILRVGGDIALSSQGRAFAARHTFDAQAAILEDIIAEHIGDTESRNPAIALPAYEGD